MTESQAREEICRVGASLFARGYVHATAGNLSVRLDESQGGGYLITPTDACLGNLDPARLARLDGHGQQLNGDRASKALALHRHIYAATLAVGGPAACVLHTHSTYCVALTLGPVSHDCAEGSHHRELLPALTPYFVMKVGRVPVIDYHRPGDAQAANKVADAIRDYASRGILIRAVVLDRLGPNVWGRSPAEAMATLEELEETARLAWLTGGSTQPLPLSALAELRETFGASW